MKFLKSKHFYYKNKLRNGRFYFKKKLLRFVNKSTTREYDNFQPMGNQREERLPVSSFFSRRETHIDRSSGNAGCCERHLATATDIPRMRAERRDQNKSR